MTKDADKRQERSGEDNALRSLSVKAASKVASGSFILGKYAVYLAMRWL